jgi:hypothetical protein
MKMTNQLFEILDGIVSSDYCEENLSSVENVKAYAENGCDVHITDAQAKKIIEVGKKWLYERENGNGEWSRMRHEAIEALAE